MDNIETVKLSDLRKKDAVVPKQSIGDYYEPVDTYNSIRNNTTIEDAVKAQPDYLDDLSTAKAIQKLNDKTNQYDLINEKLRNLDIDIASEFEGRGITQVGRRAKKLTKGRELDAQRQLVLSEVERLRGNIETAEALKKAAEKKMKSYSKTKSSSSEEDYDYSEYDFGETSMGLGEEQRSDLIQLVSIMNPKLGDKIKDYSDEKLKEMAERLGIGVGSSSFGGTGLTHLNGKTVTDEFLEETKPEDYNEYLKKYYKKNRK